MSLRAIPMYMCCALASCGDDAAPAAVPDTNDTAGDTMTADTDATPEILDTAADTTVADTPIDTAPAETTTPLPEPPSLADPILFAPAGTFGRIQVQPALAANADTLVVAWAGFDETAGSGIYARAWDLAPATPAATSEPVRVNTDTRGIQNEPTLCRLAAGAGFVVAWSIDTQETGPAAENLEVRFRRLGPDGAPIDPSDTRVLTERPGNHWLAEVACRERGGFAIAGVRPNAGGATFEVFAQGYDALGAPDGDPRVVEPIDAGGQGFPAIGVGPDDRWVMAIEDTVGANADTTIALRVLGAAPEDRSPLVDLVRRSGVDAMAPSVSVDPTTGDWIAGGVVGTRLVLRAGNAAADDLGEPIALADPPTAVTTAHALVPAQTSPTRHGLVYYVGSGASVAARVAWIADGTLLGDADTVFEGSLPLAYRPAITYAAGRLVVAWTESLGSGRYALGAALYR